MTAEARMLWALAAFFLVLSVVYGAATYEPAGATLLLLCSAAALVAVIPLHRRRRQAAEEQDAHPEATVSLWPFVIGAGAVLMVDGLVLGLWLLVPGAALVVRGLIGVLGRAGAPPEQAPHPD